MSWHGWRGGLGGGVPTASSPAPLPPGADALGLPSCARRRCSTRFTDEPRTGSRASPRRNRTAGRSTRTSCSVRDTAASPSLPSRASTGPPGRGFCATHLAPRAAPSSSSRRTRTCGDALVDSGASALLLLVGHRSRRERSSMPSATTAPRRLFDRRSGRAAGSSPSGRRPIPFLRYLAERLTPLGERVEGALRRAAQRAALLRRLRGLRHDPRPRRTAALGRVLGARRRRRHPRQDRVSPARGISVWQWTWPPVQVVRPRPGAPRALQGVRGQFSSTLTPPHRVLRLAVAGLGVVVRGRLIDRGLGVAAVRLLPRSAGC